jgi:hypothetical protein
MEETIEAARFYGQRDVRVEKVTISKPRDGEVLIAVRVVWNLRNRLARVYSWCVLKSHPMQGNLS